jgi:hypothetical protein
MFSVTSVNEADVNEVDANLIQDKNNPFGMDIQLNKQEEDQNKASPDLPAEFE